MTIVKKERTVNYTCEQMYGLVNDVERYFEFLPYCAQSVVHYRDENEVQATLVIAVAGISKSLTTRNHLQQNKMIEIRFVDGPFSHLEGFWLFEERVGEKCHISFDLEFEFDSHLMSKLIGPVFEQISEKMVDSFCNRAQQLYGSR